MLKLFSKYHPEPFVISKSSDTVEITHFEKRNESLVHLIHHPARTYADTPYVIGNIEPLADFEISLKLENKPAYVFLENPENIPDLTYENGVLTVKIRNLHIHTVIIIGKNRAR